MGPLQWWWRTWSKVIDPSREQELADALQQAEAQRQRADRLASELSSETGASEKRAADAEGELQRLRTQLSQARSSEAKLQSRVDDLQDAEAEVERLRQRAETERGETERLRKQLKEAQTERGETERLRKQLKEAQTERGETERLRKQLKEAQTERGEAERLRKQLKEAQTERGETERLQARVEELETSAAGTSGTDTSGTSDTETAPDVSGAPAVLGRSIEPDDLTVIEGVGPKIAGLLADAGISTWRELSDVDAGRVRSILTDAGPRYRVHDPESWPRQAALLAQGQWQQFKDLRAEVRKR